MASIQLFYEGYDPQWVLGKDKGPLVETKLKPAAPAAKNQPPPPIELKVPFCCEECKMKMYYITSSSERKYRRDGIRSAEDMDAKTIAQLCYEGPEGERRKVEAINEQIYEREYERERPGYTHVVPVNAKPIRSDGYGRPDHRLPGEVPRYTTASNIERRNQQEEEYRRASRHGIITVDPYSPSRRPGPGYVVLVLPVTVDRKFEEDGTVVEHVYPDSTAAATFLPRDHGKIHYGRQDSYAETVLQEAASHYHGGYPVGYSRERPPLARYTVPYNDGIYRRRPFGSPHGPSIRPSAPSGYVDDKYKR